ncbi:hypothetical protein GCM10007424_16340 [Flavobacterium suaedae]|uniref:GtrA-like protein domain-containing protein n=1 Tax=Flavobacterium suaedae TaxID=1767027 RepID=A0ABQ1JXH3_9FLAO|nr:hypothetical protein GCM10007424_16340 [Flavobacterium suaedae]
MVEKLKYKKCCFYNLIIGAIFIVINNIKVVVAYNFVATNATSVANVITFIITFVSINIYKTYIRKIYANVKRKPPQPLQRSWRI